jgi:perosamine synthetase
MSSYSYGKQTIGQSDIDAVVATLKSDFLTQGSKVKEFEDKICEVTGAKYAVAVSSGTAALHLSILALGLKPKDAGLTSPMTFAASANCLRYVGATVQFADIDSNTGLISPEEIKKKITPETKVIIPVHYSGQSADMEMIHEIAKSNNIYVIEDAAHAIGSTYQGYRVGSCQYSDLTTFSFHPVKTITTGEGGAITTNSKKLYDKLMTLRSHGITKMPEKYPWYYEMNELGYNYRLPDILAALGISQINKLSIFTKKRANLVKQYQHAFKNNPHCRVLKELSNRKTAFHLFPLLINFSKIKITKQELFRKLASRGINLQVHYIPVHYQPYYKQLGFKVGDYPHSEAYYDQEVSLPLYPALTSKDVKIIIKIIKNFIK